jgi:DegV family protein with EDD domain
MINILTDSCVDLSPDLAAHYKIDIIRLPVFINSHTYLDGQEITTPELFKFVEQTRQLPKTSAPSTANFINFFDRPGESIYIGIGSTLSATYSNAIMARQNLAGRSIRIIDSLNLSTGIGLLVLKAAELRDQGCAVEEIEAQVQALVPRVHTAFVIDTLDYLHMGGRCSTLTHIVGSLLKIHPVIEVRKDGRLGVREKIRGTRQRALNALIHDFEKHLSQLDPHRLFITHTGCDADAQYLADLIRTLAPVEDICITVAGSTIASHCGPNTIGLLYLTQH